MGKKVYDEIEIPVELNDIVNQAIASRKKEDVLKMANAAKMAGGSDVGSGQKNTNVIRLFRYAAAAAAAILVCLTVGLNTSETFAKEMQQLPVIGQLAKVLTVRSWHEAAGDYEYDVEVPEIVMESAAAKENSEEENTTAKKAAEETAADDALTAEDTAVVDETAQPGLAALQDSEFVCDINAKIQKIVDDYIAQAQVDMEAAKEAFFAAGGTEKEWNDRTMDIYVDYNVKYQQGNILSLELITAKTWAASEEERHYYNLDLEKGTSLTLEQLLGEDYIRVASESIIGQIKERMAEDENQIYFGYEANDEGLIEGFKELSPDAMFYINESGNVVIVFGEYEIAPGYMGFPEFEIP